MTAGDAKIDNAKYRAQFHMKAKMLTAEEALALTGHAIGGVCPFAVGEQVKVYLDASLRRFDTVYPSAGSSNSTVELSPQELFDCSGAVAWVDVCKDWQEDECNG